MRNAGQTSSTICAEIIRENHDKTFLHMSVGKALLCICFMGRYAAINTLDMRRLCVALSLSFY